MCMLPEAAIRGKVASALSPGGCCICHLHRFAFGQATWREAEIRHAEGALATVLVVEAASMGSSCLRQGVADQLASLIC